MCVCLRRLSHLGERNKVNPSILPPSPLPPPPSLAVRLTSPIIFLFHQCFPVPSRSMGERRSTVTPGEGISSRLRRRRHADKRRVAELISLRAKMTGLSCLRERGRETLTQGGVCKREPVITASPCRPCSPLIACSRLSRSHHTSLLTRLSHRLTAQVIADPFSASLLYFLFSCCPVLGSKYKRHNVFFLCAGSILCLQ